MNNYQKVCRLANSPQTRSSFWLAQAKSVRWIKEPTQGLDQTRAPFYRWFPDGVINICDNCIDRHFESHPEREAMVWVSNMLGKQRHFTYKELLQNVCRTALVLKSHGLKKGDTAIIFMPMIPQAIFSMLACARLGVVHSVVFGGFAAKELASRIEDCRPKVILAASCGLEPKKVVSYIQIMKDALEMVHVEKPTVLVYQRPEHPIFMPPSFLLFDPQVIEYTFVPCEPMASTDYLYILYTSGTTGKPKGIVRDHGGTAVAVQWTQTYNVGLKPGETFLSLSDIGWVVGHTFGVYGPLLAGGRTIVYEGKPTTPHPGAVWQMIEKHNVSGLYIAPTALRAIRKEDYTGEWSKKYNISSVKCINMAGQRCDIPTYQWIASLFPHSLVNDHYWQTQIGWILSCNYLNLHTFPSKPGSATKPGPGFIIEVLDAENKPVSVGTLGKICVKLPMPPSFMSTIYGNDQAFLQKYLNPAPGYYTTGDAGYYDSDGYLNVLTRLDDIINTAGHRLSTAAMEQVLIKSGKVIQAAVVGKVDSLRGEIPVAFVVAKPQIDVKNLQKQLITLIRKEIGPVAAFQSVLRVEKLPKTKSGKILRSILRRILENQPYEVPPTIEDETVLETIKELAVKAGYGKGKELVYRDQLDIKNQSTQNIQEIY